MARRGRFAVEVADLRRQTDPLNSHDHWEYHEAFSGMSLARAKKMSGDLMLCPFIVSTRLRKDGYLHHLGWDRTLKRDEWIWLLGYRAALQRAQGRDPVTSESVRGSLQIWERVVLTLEPPPSD